MRLLILIAVIGAAFWAYSERMIPGVNQAGGAYADDGSAKTLLFTSTQCGAPCVNMRRDLYKRRAVFDEVDISAQDQSNPDIQIWKKLGGAALPFLIAGEHSSTVSKSSEVGSVLAMAYGKKHLNDNERELYEGHFDQYGDPIVVIYGADWCPYCVKLQKQLSDDKITYVEIDVEKHRNKAGISKTMDIRGYPSTWYGYHRVKGIDVKAVKRTIRTASY